MRHLVTLALLLAGPFALAQSYDTLSFSGQEFVLADIPGGTFLMGDHSEGSYVDAIGESRDELPVHSVRLSPFRMGAAEVTNAQFELFFPGHRALRGIEGFSIDDDEPVCNVSWEEASEFCRRLSEATGRSFRLPTEAEWEYACRAGTSTDFAYGNVLPFSEWLHQRTERYKVPVVLGVNSSSRPNPWGLYNMHGSLEEWCYDWYGPYTCPSSDPVGPSDGDFRVTRGGSHNTPERYLRSTNRSAMHPDDRSVMVGFRIVEAAPIPARKRPATLILDEPDPVDISMAPAASPLASAATSSAPLASAATSSAPLAPAATSSTPLASAATFSTPLAAATSSAPLASVLTTDHTFPLRPEPFFATPVPYVVAPTDDSVPFYHHNHQPAVTWAGDGSLLAIWFSCEAESGREMVVLSSRWTESGGWSPAELFFDVPDRNMTGAALVRVGNRIVHLAGVGDAGDWRDLVLLSRYSLDGGRHWSHPVVAEPGHHSRHQVIAGPIVTSAPLPASSACTSADASSAGALLTCSSACTLPDTSSASASLAVSSACTLPDTPLADVLLPAEAILLACDAGPGGQDGTSLHLSLDSGLTFTDLGRVPLTDLGSYALAVPGAPSLISPCDAVLSSPDGSSLSSPDGSSLASPDASSLSSLGGTSLTPPCGTSLTSPDAPSLTSHGGTSLTSPDAPSLTFTGGTSLTDPRVDPTVEPSPERKRDRQAPRAVFSGTGRDIAGIHAGVVTLSDGAIMAFGRGNAIDGHMPQSISRDGGRTWTYSATEFPAIGTGQRLILRRLNEGPLLLCSFDADGLFAAVSYDEGATWPVKKRITDGSGTVLDGGAWTGTFTLDATHGEPKGYLAATQTPDGIIHLLSSRVHYRFNLSWLEQ